MPESITATPTPLPVRPLACATSAPTVFGKAVCSAGGVVAAGTLLTTVPTVPVLRTFVLSVTLTTPLAALSARACLAGSLTAKPPIDGRRSVILPWWARTMARAFFSDRPGLNCARATTERLGADFAAAFSFAAAVGAAGATGPPTASGTAMAVRARAAPLRQRHFGVG